MGQPVKLSDQLVDDARAVVPYSQRSLAGQIEFWATLGKSIEPLLRGARALALQASGKQQPLSEIVADVDSAAGRRRVADHLAQRPYPHYKPVSGRPDLVCRIDADGSETTGRFVDREFVPVEAER